VDVSWFKTALGAAAAAVARDAVVKPRQLGAAARSYCDRVNKPLLLISDPGLVSKVIGPPVRAEVSMRRAGRLPVKDKHFGAVLAIGILERQPRPDLALQEWRRVADTVFVVVPPWWSPMTWLNPEHKWYVEPTLKKGFPLWTDRRHVYLLRVSDKGYGTPRCPTPKTTTPPRDTGSLPVPDFRGGGARSENDALPPVSQVTHLVTVGDGRDLPDLDEYPPFGS
jgi:hypothetical protein